MSDLVEQREPGTPHELVGKRLDFVCKRSSSVDNESRGRAVAPLSRYFTKLFYR